MASVTAADDVQYCVIRNSPSRYGEIILDAALYERYVHWCVGLIGSVDGFIIYNCSKVLKKQIIDNCSLISNGDVCFITHFN